MRKTISSGGLLFEAAMHPVKIWSQKGQKVVTVKVELTDDGRGPVFYVDGEEMSPAALQEQHGFCKPYDPRYFYSAGWGFDLVP
jgi:hypothetical protein